MRPGRAAVAPRGRRARPRRRLRREPRPPGTGGVGGSTAGSPGGRQPCSGLNTYINPSDPCDSCAQRVPGRAGWPRWARARFIVADTANPAGGFTSAEYASFAAAFDTLAYPVDVQHFGRPTDLDRNGRVIIFFTSAVNALTPRGASFVVGGFFWNRDLFPRAGTRGCLGSNDGELFYMLAPDPSGTVNGNARTRDYVLRTSVAVLAHEFQHLINASRRLYVLNSSTFNEEVWLNEGLSHAAEELVFFRATRLAPRSRIALATLRASTPGSPRSTRTTCRTSRA
jgi:hypothetical protein